MAGMGLEDVFPEEDETYGFATYFILHEFGITEPKVVSSVLLFLSGDSSSYPIRLYIWNDQGNLKPNSAGIPLYVNMNQLWHSFHEWNEFVIPGDIILPDTFWIGFCYNYLSIPVDWYIGMNKHMEDHHTYCNGYGGPNDWVDFISHAFGVRVYVIDVPGIEEDHLIFSKEIFYMINPNPIVTHTNIHFSLPNRSWVSLKIYNVAGQIVNTLVHTSLDQGNYNYPWNKIDVHGHQVCKGVYFIDLEINGKKYNRKVLVL